MVDRILKVAALQIDMIWEDSNANLKKIEKLIGLTNADLIVLPEMFTTGFSMSPCNVAQPMNGSVVSRMVELSQSYGRAIIGSIAIEDGGLYYNRLFFFTPDGLYQTYDKRHTFRMGGEDRLYTSGSEKLIVEYRGFRICPLICYDLRFPVWSRNYSDYDVLIYVACWPESRRQVWNTLLVARAIENACYCIGVNRCGNEPGIKYAGESQIVDYMGRSMMEIGSSGEQIVDYSEERPTEGGAQGEQIVKAEFSMKKLEEFRQKFPVHLDADKFTIEF